MSQVHDDPQVQLCNDLAIEVSNLIIKRLTDADAMAMTIPVTVEMVAVTLLIKCGNDPGVIDHLCNAIRDKTTEYRKRGSN